MATIELEKYPKLNPAIFDMLRNSMGVVTGFNKYGISWYLWILYSIVLIVMIYYTVKIYWTLETPSNIRRILNNNLNKFSDYAENKSKRLGLVDYINTLKDNGIPDSNFALTNFYVSSSNTPAIFTPAKDGIVSPEAIKLTLAAGARYLDFGILSDGKQNNYRPILCALDANSSWRRITLNSMPFKLAMETVVKYGFAGRYADINTNSAPYKNDPLFIMLRFEGKTRPETFTEVANILRASIEANRLDFTYNKARNMKNLFRTPITEFLNKVIILSNVYPPTDNLLSEYINVGPRSALPLNMSSSEIKNIPDTNRADIIKKIMMNLTESRSEDYDTNTNDWAMAHSYGVHFATMNFWSQDSGLSTYLSDNNFGKYGFKIKPDALRHIITYIKPALQPNPELNARDGKPMAPPGIVLPV